jgi:hypothetical protein
MSLATASAIRDRIYTLLESLTPTSLASTKLVRYRNEGAANFDDWAQKNPAGAFRRFQVREASDDGEPLVSNTLQELVSTEYEIRIAYPQTHRYGAANGMSRDDVRKEDWKLIKQAIGINGRANFTGTYDCTPLGATEQMDKDGAIDYSVVRARFEYTRTTT